MTTKLLTQAQAEAVYSAMCALNNVSSMQGVELRFVGNDSNNEYLRYGVKEEVDGELIAYAGPGVLGMKHESYPSQAAFAAAYGLE